MSTMERFQQEKLQFGETKAQKKKIKRHTLSETQAKSGNRARETSKRNAWKKKSQQLL